MIYSAAAAADRAPGRIRIADGQAEIQPALPVPPGLIPGEFSVLSPGTERRHLTGADRWAGYMTLGRGDRSEPWRLAPVPHGAPFDPAGDGVVTAPPGTGIEGAALARFQQIAVLGLARLPQTADLNGAAVVGSGPVALGCALELRRRGASTVRIITSRPAPPITHTPGVKTVPDLPAASAPLVLDTTGVPERAAEMTAPGGILGLLGTPGDTATVSARHGHRHGWSVIGMHELAPHPPLAYQHAYATSAAWITDHIEPDLLHLWCQILPGETAAPDIYRRLAVGRGRPQHPVIIFDWSSR